MPGALVRKPTELTQSQDASAPNRGVITRKIWLPKLVYDALPYFYLLAGVTAFLATLYISEWFWVLPHYLLFSAGCIHLGALVLRRRHHRSARPDGDDEGYNRA